MTALGNTPLNAEIATSAAVAVASAPVINLDLSQSDQMYYDVTVDQNMTINLTNPGVTPRTMYLLLNHTGILPKTVTLGNNIISPAPAIVGVVAKRLAVEFMIMSDGKAREMARSSWL